LGETGGGLGDGGFDPLLDRALVRAAGGGEGDQIGGQGIGVVDDDRIGGAAGELVIEQPEAGGAGGEACEHREQGGFERIGAGGLVACQGAKALGLALVVVGIAAEAADHPADGIGFAFQGLAVACFCGEAFLQIGDSTGVVLGVLGVEAFGQLGDPAGFGLELGAQLPERRAPWSLLRRGGDGDGDRHWEAGLRG
jgi:hypothetical protein